MNLRLPQPQDISGKTVLVRVDYNVPLKEVEGKQVVEDDRRLVASLETLRFLMANGAKAVLVSHLGRPSAAREPELSLAPVAEFLKTQLQLPTTFVPECVGTEVQKAIASLQPGQLLLLENVRYHAEEEANDANFAQQLATGCEVYINEAFSAAHRAHASTEGVAHLLPAFAGFQLAKEVQALDKVILQPERPFVVVVGGAKIADKVGSLTHLAHLADVVLVGGGIANTFMKAEGLEIHKSYIQDAPADLKQKGIDYIHVAHDLLEEVKTEKVVVQGHYPLPKILYPIDVVAAPQLETTDSTQTQIIDLTHDMKDTPNDQELMYLDIGPKTIQLYAELIKTARTVFWNGPMGVFENELFTAGTREIATAITEATSQGAFSVIGGGDTLSAADHFQLMDKFSYVSTAGGASMEFLAGKELPGLKPLVES